MQCTDVNVLSPLASYSVPATAVELPQGVGSDAAQARHTSFQAAEKRALQETQRGIGDVTVVQAMQKASATADAAASKGTEMFGHRCQLQL